MTEREWREKKIVSIAYQKHRVGNCCGNQSEMRRELKRKRKTTESNEIQT